MCKRMMNMCEKWATAVRLDDGTWSVESPVDDCNADAVKFSLEVDMYKKPLLGKVIPYFHSLDLEETACKRRDHLNSELEKLRNYKKNKSD